ncbi:glycosyltransferase family 61 protein [Alteromonas sp. H39]|uniref:glycosyltransferase family 61 protein n=1 Tax=Alteromonas sp. H39 TaxID=3389876 RepID=UPI0039DF83EF
MIEFEKRFIEGNGSDCLVNELLQLVERNEISERSFVKCISYLRANRNYKQALIIAAHYEGIVNTVKGLSEIAYVYQAVHLYSAAAEVLLVAVKNGGGLGIITRVFRCYRLSGNSTLVIDYLSNLSSDFLKNAAILREVYLALYNNKKVFDYLIGFGNEIEGNKVLAIAKLYALQGNVASALALKDFFSDPQMHQELDLTIKSYEQKKAPLKTEIYNQNSQVDFIDVSNSGVRIAYLYDETSLVKTIELVTSFGVVSEVDLKVNKQADSGSELKIVIDFKFPELIYEELEYFVLRAKETAEVIAEVPRKCLEVRGIELLTEDSVPGKVVNLNIVGNRLSLLQNAAFNGEGAIIFGKYLILESAYKRLNGYSESMIFSKDKKSVYLFYKKVDKSISLILNCLTLNWTNYYHYVIDFYLRLAVSKRVVVDGSLKYYLSNLPFSELMPFQRFFLESSFPDMEPFVLSPTEMTYADSLLFPYQVPTRSSDNFQILKGIISSKKVKSRSLIYIDRRNAKNRRIQNENQIIAMLIEHGFKIIKPEDLSVNEQVSIFSEAKVIVSASGAALTNSIFMRDESVLVELIGEDVDANFWPSFTSSLKIDHKQLPMKIKQKSYSSLNNIYEADLVALKHNLEKILSTSNIT